MAKHWEGKKDECYRLYITEDKSAHEIAEIFQERGFHRWYVAFDNLHDKHLHSDCGDDEVMSPFIYFSHAYSSAPLKIKLESKRLKVLA